MINGKLLIALVIFLPIVLIMAFSDSSNSTNSTTPLPTILSVTASSKPTPSSIPLPTFVPYVYRPVPVVPYYSDSTSYNNSSVSDTTPIQEISGTYTVEACSQNSGNCYDLEADISSGTVETIYFPNGGHIDLSAELDENGEGEDYVNSDNWTITCSECVNN